MARLAYLVLVGAAACSGGGDDDGGATGDVVRVDGSRDAATTPDVVPRVDGATQDAPAPPRDGGSLPDPCNVAASCGACAATNGCGWCNGACVSGTVSGPLLGGTCAGGWAWLTNQCPGTDAGCTPACAGRTCGSNGCGGVCGSCAAGQVCNASGACATTCTPSCAGHNCGSDGCSGTCGTCGAGQACNASGTCATLCTPMCAGRACGSDGCGGSCGSCAGGAACTAGGTCAVCTEGATQCVAGNIGQTRRCVGGAWTVSACGNFQLCTSGACRAICEEVVPVATGAYVCAVPNADGVNNGNWLITSDTSRLPTARLAAGAFNFGGTVPAPIIAAPGRTWPWAWETNGPGSIVFPLNSFSDPVGRVAMRVASRRADVSLNATRHFFGFNGGSGVFASVPNPPTGITSTTWTPYYAYITGSGGAPTTASFTYGAGGGNSVSYAFTGDGFGDPWDSMELNWMFLQIDP